MTPAHPSTATRSSAPHARLAWMTSSAIAGTIGTTASAFITFFLSIIFQPSFDFSEPDQAQVIVGLFQQMILATLRDGLSLGLFLGLCLTLAWSPLIAGAVRSPTRWIKASIISTVIGTTFAFLGIGLLEWQYHRSLLISAFGGTIAGLIIGIVQGTLIWAHCRARLRWVIAQCLAFACIFMLMSYANREISGFLLFPFVWLAMWGLYGLFMGHTFEEIQYGYPNEEL